MNIDSSKKLSAKHRATAIAIKDYTAHFHRKCLTKKNSKVTKVMIYPLLVYRYSRSARTYYARRLQTHLHPHNLQDALLKEASIPCVYNKQY